MFFLGVKAFNTAAYFLRGWREDSGGWRENSGGWTCPMEETWGSMGSVTSKTRA